ncbi:hypothetical protein BDP27DRAFT_1367716 [Rhodocollybia butyracea]|uniref:Uncharacterized protein n=1 Tax=Rhodocollybia butyracea TaxID=206335 RepID=A0A9P5U2T1_9AGAR|nr:hypothetical protein BDP27DRAFT_1367716 [Rhodocollybia butyracea]
MAPIRAYYLPADSASTTDTSRPAQELGYPVTQEGCAVGVDLEVEKNAATLTPEMVALLMKLLHSASSDICTTKDAAAVVASGTPSLHIEDVIEKAWIQLDIVPGTFIRFPAGAKFRLTFDEKNRKAAGIVFFKETIHNHGLLRRARLRIIRSVKLISTLRLLYRSTMMTVLERAYC